MPNEFGSFNLNHFEEKIRGDHEAAYASFKTSENELGKMGPLALNEYSLRLLQTFLSDKHLLSIRELFYQELDERFGLLNSISGAFNNSYQKFPLCYPLQTLGALHASTLVDKKVFAPVYWPTLADKELNEFELRLIDKTVFLPLSNIRDRRDFEYLMETVSDLLVDQM